MGKTKAKNNVKNGFLPNWENEKMDNLFGAFVVISTQNHRIIPI